MKHRPTTFIAAPPRHSGRPGPWTQLPWRVLGMLFIAALLLLSGQHRTSLGSVPGPAPAGDASVNAPHHP